MKIILCSDHAGFELKEKIKAYILQKGLELLDVGTNIVDDNDSYVDYAKQANKFIVQDNVGIYVCGSGVGMCIVANKQKGVRAVNVQTENIAKLAREHNNANVLCLGARIVDEKTAYKIVDVFLSTGFLGGKHTQRVESIE